MLTAEHLRLKITRNRIKAVDVAQAVGISSAHLSRLLNERVHLSEGLAVQIDAAIDRLAQLEAKKRALFAKPAAHR